MMHCFTERRQGKHLYLLNDYEFHVMEHIWQDSLTDALIAVQRYLVLFFWHRVLNNLLKYDQLVKAQMMVTEGMQKMFKESVHHWEFEAECYNDGFSESWLLL